MGLPRGHAALGSTRVAGSAGAGKKLRGVAAGAAIMARPNVQAGSRGRPQSLPHESHRIGVVAAPTRGIALRTLLVLSCALPLLVWAVASWRSWYFERAEVEDTAASTIGLLEEHVRKVLDTQVLVLNWIADRTEASSWEEIERSRPLYELLTFLDSSYAQIDGIFMVDESGRLRMNSHQFPLQRSIALADRDYFQALSSHRSPLFISASYAGRWTGDVAFRVARPLATPDGAFKGVVGLAVHIDYFEQYFRRLVGDSGSAVLLMRDDGQVLAKFPPTAAEIEDWRYAARPAKENVRELHAAVAAGVSSLTAVDAVAGYPIVLVYRIPQSVIFAVWVKNFAIYGIVALISACVLSSVTYIAIRGQRRERTAVAAWQLEQLQRLGAEADARRLGKYEALGTLAGGIAHHFNNLLPALSGHLEIAMEEAGPGNRAQPRLRRLSQEVAGARKIIRDILVFSRREITPFRRVDLGAVAAQSADMFRASVARTAVLETDISLGIQVLGDPVQLSQLVTNLLRNAYDALDAESGTIVLAVGTAPVSDTPGQTARGAAARLVCSDTGSGMSAEVLERAFDPFFTTKPPGSGSGLGLSICDGIIRSHGGQVFLDSVVGRGTTVTVLLPQAEEGAD
jgi:signal transduction histidine kinase